MKFEDYTSGKVNLKLLNNNICNSKGRQKYYNNWMSKYSKIFKEATEFDIIKWTIRINKSLKQIFASATFYTEAQLTLKDGFLNSYYYLMYYSLFHALLSTLYLDDKETIDNLINITHSKLLNCFISNFCNRKSPIITTDIEKHFETLKFLREYSSYSMPLNEFFINNKDILDPQNFLLEDIKQCFQVTNLHSIMVENSSEKHGGSVNINYKNTGFLEEYYNKVNGKKEPFQNRYLLDHADKHKLYELIQTGCHIHRITLDLEHWFDEFHTYGFFDGRFNKERYSEISSEAFKLIYNTIT